MQQKFGWQKEKVKLFASSGKEAIITLRTVWAVNTHTGERRGRSDYFQRRGLAVIEKRFFKILKCDLKFAVIVTRIIEKMGFPVFLHCPLHPCCYPPGFLPHRSSRKSNVRRMWRLFSTKKMVGKKFSLWKQVKQGVSRNSVARHPECISVNWPRKYLIKALVVFFLVFEQHHLHHYETFCLQNQSTSVPLLFFFVCVFWLETLEMWLLKHTTITFFMANLSSGQEVMRIKTRATREKATTGWESAQELNVERKMRKALL